MNQPVIPWDVHLAQEKIASHTSAIEGLDRVIAAAKKLNSFATEVSLASRRSYHEAERMKWELELRRARGW